MSRVFVAGGTGTAGRAYARAFLAAGHEVRASLRPGTDAAVDAGAQPWPVDFDDATATGAAVEGCDVVVISLAGRGGKAAANEASITRVVGQAAAAAGALHVVYTSVHRADASTGVPHFDVKGRLEAQLTGLVPRLTVLRPATFADSLTAPWLRTSIDENGVLVSPIGRDTLISHVSTDDLARVAVAALQEPETQGQPVVVSGEQPCTYDELLPLFSELTGREVTLRTRRPAFNMSSILVRPAPQLHRQRTDLPFAALYRSSNVDRRLQRADLRGVSLRARRRAGRCSRVTGRRRGLGARADVPAGDGRAPWPGRRAERRSARAASRSCRAPDTWPTF